MACSAPYHYNNEIWKYCTSQLIAKRGTNAEAIEMFIESTCFRIFDIVIADKNIWKKVKNICGLYLET